MTVNERLNEFMKIKDYNYTNFAKKIGTTPTTIRRVVLGDTSPSYSTVVSIKELHPEINLHLYYSLHFLK